jgi:hypothetical protein
MTAIFLAGSTLAEHQQADVYDATRAQASSGRSNRLAVTLRWFVVKFESR